MKKMYDLYETQMGIYFPNPDYTNITVYMTFSFVGTDGHPVNNNMTFKELVKNVLGDGQFSCFGGGNGLPDNIYKFYVNYKENMFIANGWGGEYQVQLDEVEIDSSTTRAIGCPIISEDN